MAAPDSSIRGGAGDDAPQGALVRNILEAQNELRRAGERPGAAGDDATGADAGGTGIILQRRNRSAQNQKASDLSQVRLSRLQLNSLLPSNGGCPGAPF